MRHVAPFVVLASLATLVLACTEEPAPPVPALTVGREAPTPPAGKAFAATPRKTFSLPTAVARLIPADAVGLVHLRNPAAVVERAKALADAFQPGTGGLLGLGPLLQPTGLRERDIDLTRDSTLALTLDESGPIATAILPAKRPEEAADVATLEAVVSGDLVAFATRGKPVLHPASTFGADLIEGDIVVRLDVPKLLARYGSRLTSLLDPVPLQAMGIPLNPSTLPMLRAGTEQLQAILADTRWLTVALSIRDGDLDVDVVATADHEFPAAAGVGFDLARRIALPGAGFVLYSSVDLSPLVRANVELAQTAQGDREAVQRMVQRSEALWAAMGPEVTLTYRYAPTGIEALGVAGPQDGAKLREAAQAYIAEMEANGKGRAQIQAAVEQTVAGVRFQGWRIGSGSAPPVAIALGTAGDQAILALGEVGPQVPHLIHALEQDTIFDHPLLAGVEGVHAAPRLFVAHDMTASIRASAAVHGVKLPPVDPAILWCSFATPGSQRELQLHLDVAPLFAAIRAVTKAQSR